MTPAVLVAKKAGVAHKVHEYEHSSSCTSFGEEAVAALGVEAGRVFKTLLVSLNGDPKKLAVAIVPVPGKLDLKACARALKAKKADMADPVIAERTTGYVVGGISPLGQKKRLPTLLDESALGFETIHVSAGKRGLEIELSAADLCSLTQGVTAPIAKEA
ncbi:Cys-tRNA(Pro) deacylase [Parendozoicomonas haliclonae]|uniref:Cys-tRNA(Pro)/Cys-tRNA(Cys) deacylase n=1 Tax=Parendozoicomonas haliclonae TaxID=1960125 RepID=A0A1X7AJA2_9GAMM|nr:Cys-tRNA(Pro) deacylase [Parendozoicomonas haliclonae]SMA45504.1 Cys-tRNA(Pro)/Cys-tRNA(Cys) deacylase YbaK [Parendozoicomonas haliclonae]